ncbi:MAG TPA: serine hydrolase domain-containing protein [Blastocatellia bacterium]|nr:serine hydrolase domain-containing protein [Blastocatellia bacterium]
MKSKRLYTFVATQLMAALLLSSPVAAQTASVVKPNQPAAEVPATPVGKLGRAFIEAINSGNKTAQASFITSSFSESALKQASADEYLANFQKLYSQSGGFDVMAVMPSQNPDELRLRLKSKRGSRWVMFITRLDKAQPERLDGFGLRLVSDPESEKANAWSEAKMDEAGVTKEIERHVERAAAEDRFSGVVLVAKGERLIFNKAYGMAERGFGAANKLDTKFNLGSMNKMFTSVAIAQLVEAGKLAYDDTLAKVLPEYPNKQVAEKITIHQLLTHTSGLGDFFKPEFFQNREKYKNPTDYFPIFANDPLRFEPGKGWSYSNAAFVVLGAVVEKVSGQSYFDYVRDHVFIPAGMKDTASYAADEVVPNLAIGYTRFGGDDPLGLEPRRANYMSLPLKGSPAGGGYSTAPDLLRFAQALRARKLLGAELTEKVTGGKVDTPWGLKYSYGFMDEAVGGKSVRGHGGGAPGINSDLKIFWDGSYTVIVMGNYDPPAAQDLAGKITQFLARQ